MLAMAESLPIHVMSGPDLIASYMKRCFPKLKRGDGFLHNSPYHGNSHAADWCVVIPVIDGEGQHRFTVLAKAHLADCGNSVPTTYMAEARDVYEEGALIFPCVKVQEGYEIREDVLRMARVRIRVPDLWHGDFLALLGAARIGERRLLELLRDFGAQALGDYVDAWFDYSEVRMVAAIRRLPSGTVIRHIRHDPAPGMPDGVLIKVVVSVDSESALVEVDLRDNIDCQPFGLNLTEATARTAAMVGVFSALGEMVPPNAGSFRRLRVHLRDNCVVGIPRHPTSCSAATSDLADNTANCVASAIAELGDGFGIAEAGRAQPASAGVISGVNVHDHEGRYVNQLILAVTGGPGTPKADGWLTIFTLAGAGLLLRDSVEIDEMKYPVRVDKQHIIGNSEGAGRFRGSPGAFVEYGPVAGTMEVFYLSDGTVHPARGVHGGLDGARARQHKRFADGTLSEGLNSFGRVLLEPGETIVSMSCGGGGYGPPDEREPARVAKDVREGWITRERAREVYGVELDGKGGVDIAGTAAQRRALQGGGPAKMEA